MLAYTLTPVATSTGLVTVGKPEYTAIEPIIGDSEVVLSQGVSANVFR